MANVDFAGHDALAVGVRNENGTAVIRLPGDLDVTSVKQALADDWGVTPSPDARAEHGPASR